MRTRLFLPMLLCLLSSCISVGKLATAEQMRHEYVQDLSGLSKDVIYDQIIRWMALNFNSSKEVIEVMDKSSGTVIGKGGISEFRFGTEEARKTGYLRFTFVFDARDNKARFNFTVISVVRGNELSGWRDVGESEEVHIAAHKEFQTLVNKIYLNVTKEDKF